MILKPIEKQAQILVGLDGDNAGLISD